MATVAVVLLACGGDVSVIETPDADAPDAAPDSSALDAAIDSAIDPSDASDASDAATDAECARTLVFEDTFDDGMLEVGPGGGFEAVQNTSNGRIEERDGVLEIETSLTSPGVEPLHGAVHATALPPGEFVIEWEVASADLPRWNGIVLALQGNRRTWERTNLGLGIQVRGDAGGTPGSVEVTTLEPSATLFSQPYSIAELSDGFVVELTVRSDGYALRVDGLQATSIEAEGALDMTAVLGDARYVSLFIQGDNSDVESRILRVERISAWEQTCP